MKVDKYTVAKRYGKALFEVALERHELDSIYQELVVLKEVANEIKGVGEWLSGNRLEIREKKELVNSLTQHFSETLSVFLTIVFDYSRVPVLLLIIADYERRYNDYKQLLVGTVWTAVPLTQKQHHLMETTIASRLGYQEAHLVNRIDPNVIGGVVIEAAGKVIDGSIQKQLKMLEKVLLE